MKLLSLFLLAFCLSVMASAQGSLQFNKAVLLEAHQSDCASCWTVPAGKVWKVTSMSTNSSNLASIHVNGYTLGFLSRSTTQSESRWVIEFPLWLPAAATMGYTNLGSNRNITFFALEFNVVP